MVNTKMIKNSTTREDLCLLILLPANDAAKNYCNQIESSLTCQIQMESNRIENGLIYKCMKQETKISKHDKQSLVNSFRNLTIEKQNKDLIKQRRVKINKRFLSTSPITKSIQDSNVPHTFTLWYRNKKNIADG